MAAKVHFTRPPALNGNLTTANIHKYENIMNLVLEANYISVGSATTLLCHYVLMPHQCPWLSLLLFHYLFSCFFICPSFFFLYSVFGTIKRGGNCTWLRSSGRFESGLSHFCGSVRMCHGLLSHRDTFTSGVMPVWQIKVTNRRLQWRDIKGGIVWRWQCEDCRALRELPSHYLQPVCFYFSTGLDCAVEYDYDEVKCNDQSEKSLVEYVLQNRKHGDDF